MVYGALKYISKQIYIPRAISLKNKNLVALDNALSLDSSHVLGWESLKPLAGIEWVDPPVVKYSLELSVVVVVMVSPLLTIWTERKYNYILKIFSSSCSDCGSVGLIPYSIILCTIFLYYSYSTTKKWIVEFYFCVSFAVRN